MTLATQVTTYCKGPQIHELMLAMTDGERPLNYLANPTKSWPEPFSDLKAFPEAFERTERDLIVYGQASVDSGGLHPMTFVGTPNGGVIEVGEYDWLHGFTEHPGGGRAEYLRAFDRMDLAVAFFIEERKLRLAAPVGEPKLITPMRLKRRGTDFQLVARDESHFVLVSFSLASPYVGLRWLLPDED